MRSLNKYEFKRPPSGCIVNDGELCDGYAILMTKIDVSYGAWGLYNYYRMQVHELGWFK